MGNYSDKGRRVRRHAILAFASIVLLAATLWGGPVGAVTYVSAEPIPSEAIVGAAKLGRIEGIGYANMALWAGRLLDDCEIVANVIHVLSTDGAISTVTAANTRALVAAGGFQGVTDPSYVLTIEDRGPRAASAADIYAVDNALGYALNQGGTSQFGLSYNPNNANEFPLAYAVVTFDAALTGEQAQAFFNYLGTIDPALWSGANAGFTQIALPHAVMNDTMLFLIGNVSTSEFTQGLSQAAHTTTGATYAPLRRNGQPTVATAGVAFPGNGWTTPTGGYLENLPNSARLVQDLKVLRRRHLQAAANLLQAIDHGNVTQYLGQGFSCP